MGEDKSTETYLEVKQMVKLAEKDVKNALENIFQIFKKVEENLNAENTFLIQNIHRTPSNNKIIWFKK